MSIVIPFLAFLLAGAFAAYHRIRLAYWAAITASLLVACWLLGANPTATVVAGAVGLAVAVSRLVGPVAELERTTLRTVQRAVLVDVVAVAAAGGVGAFGFPLFGGPARLLAWFHHEESSR